MKIERIILRLVRIPLKFEFQNRWQRIREWTKLIVEVQAGNISGYGECTAMETPYYSYETIDTASWVIKRWLAERILNRPLEHPREIDGTFSLICGHDEGKAALECACWDLYARMQSRPLYEVIGGRKRTVTAGATVGVKSDLEAALKAVGNTVSAGYDRIKLKIKPGWDENLLAAVRSNFPRIVILADANGAYGEADMDWLASLERFAPLILEQPFPAAAWKRLSSLQARTSIPICLDESVRCLEDVEHMIYLKAGRILNLKVGRVGGIASAMRIHDLCAEADIPIFIGSKIETGIGRWMNICVGTLGNVHYPSDVSASERYFVDEIVRDPVRLVCHGAVEPLAGPGFGTEVDPMKLLKYTVKTEVIPA